MKPSEFVSKVVDLYIAKESIFANRVNVEDWVPPNLDNTGKAFFLFYITQLDYATKSSSLYSGAVKLAKINPHFFNAETITNLQTAELEKILKEYLRPRYINEAVNRYKLNSQKLIVEYLNNPLNIFNETDADAVLKKIYTFRGFGPKTGNLFFRSMVTTFKPNLKNIDKVLPPVDIHDVRIANFMGYSNTLDMNEQNINNVKQLWSNACAEAGVDWVVFDKALWLLGSVGKPTSREEIYNQLLI